MARLKFTPEDRSSKSRSNIPQDTRLVAGAGDQVSVLVRDILTRRDVALVAAEHLRNRNIASLVGRRVEVEDRANAVEAATGDRLARGRERARHHPRTRKLYGMRFLARQRVPNYQPSVLRRAHDSILF